MSSVRPFVVMVDDDILDAMIVRKAFEREKGEVKFLHIGSGRDLLTFLDSMSAETATLPDELPDVILLDINMPDLNGFQVLRALRADPRKQHLPVTMFTTSGQPEDVVKSYQEGANSFIVKPGSVLEMQQFVAGFHAFWFKLAKLPGTETSLPSM